MDSCNNRKHEITWILSYPRSGNHLIRTYIEYMTKHPTLGRNINDDPPIFQRNERLNNFLKISNKNPIAIKAHYAKKNISPYLHPKDSLIFILRSPIECCISHGNQPDYKEEYIKNINFFINFKGPKLLLYYEDIVDKTNNEFICKLGAFFNINSNVIEETIKKRNEIDNMALTALIRPSKSHNDIHYYKKEHAFDKNKKIFPSELHCLLSRYADDITFKTLNQ